MLCRCVCVCVAVPGRCDFITRRSRVPFDSESINNQSVPTRNAYAALPLLGEASAERRTSTSSAVLRSNGHTHLCAQKQHRAVSPGLAKPCITNPYRAVSASSFKIERRADHMPSAVSVSPYSPSRKYSCNEPVKSEVGGWVDPGCLNQIDPSCLPRLLSRATLCALASLHMHNSSRNVTWNSQDPKIPVFCFSIGDCW